MSHHESKIVELNEEISNHEKKKFELEYTISQLTSQVAEKGQLMVTVSELQEKHDALRDKNLAFEEKKA